MDQNVFLLGILVILVLLLDSDIKKIASKIESLERDVREQGNLIRKIPDEIIFSQRKNDDVGENVCESQTSFFPNGKDPLLFDVACWGVEVSGIMLDAVKRHFLVSENRAKNIVDQLYYLNVCGPNNGDTKPRSMLVSMDEILQMERSGRFK